MNTLLNMMPKRMHLNVLMAALLFGLAPLITHAQPRDAFPLWPDGAPGALGKEDKDIPTLTPYFANPAKATGAAVVICPGGGYGGLAPHEGFQYALWLNEQGITGFVCRGAIKTGQACAIKTGIMPGGYCHRIAIS